MAPANFQSLLSPSELSYLHTNLSHTPPIRPDLRSQTAFRPLVAESNVLPGTHGSARIFAHDGAEVVVGIRGDVEERARSRAESAMGVSREGGGERRRDDGEDEGEGEGEVGNSEWVQVSIDIPGSKTDDALPVFLNAMLAEALVGSGLPGRLGINARFHWKLDIDVLLLSPPLSYPLPLLSLTIHLALLSTRLPRLKSEKDEDPMFDDDWEASTYIYPSTSPLRPPITLLVMTVGSNIIFDPSGDELAVAESVLAVSVSKGQILAVRTIDPPSKITPPGVPDTFDASEGVMATMSAQQVTAAREAVGKEGLWAPPRGGIKRELITKIMKMIVEKGGTADEVMDGLSGVE